MKLIVYLIVLVMFLPSIYSEDMCLVDSLEYLLYENCDVFEIVNECHGASFCGNEDYNVECNYDPDGICPSNYGDWDDCWENNYGSYCSPCDPDCDIDCGQSVSINVQNIKYPGESNIDIEVNALGREGAYIYNLTEVDDEGAPSEDIVGTIDINCQLDNCSHSFGIDPGALEFLEGDACEEYTFQVDFCSGNCDIPIITVQDTGIISPYINITYPNPDDILEGDVIIQAYTECVGGTIDWIDYYLCDEGGCNLITTLDGGDSSYNWNTLNHLNGAYTLYGMIIGGKGGNFDWYATDPITITLDNPPGSNYKGSTLLNLLLVKVKTWL